MSLVITVNLFQCSGLKATVCPSTHTQKKRKSLWKDSYMEIPNFLHWGSAALFFEEELFLKHWQVCVHALLAILTSIWWAPELSTATWSLGQNTSVFHYPNFTVTASMHRRLISRDKPLKNLYIIMQSSTGWKHIVDCSPLNKGKNGEAKMRSIPLPKTAMKRSAVGCTTITTSLILDPPPFF